MPGTDNNLTTGQEADLADEFLTAAEARWDTAENFRNSSYPTALEHLGKALRSVADVPVLLRAVRAVRALHKPEGYTETYTYCATHEAHAGSRVISDIAECEACSRCVTTRRVRCWQSSCPDEWPCPTDAAITKALTGANDA
jgi:hypothetical protein